MSKGKQEQKKKSTRRCLETCKMLTQKCLLSGQKVSHQHSVGLELVSHRQLSSACRRAQAIAWDLKEKSYLRACEKIGGGTHSSYKLVYSQGVKLENTA